MARSDGRHIADLLNGDVEVLPAGPAEPPDVGRVKLWATNDVHNGSTMRLRLRGACASRNLPDNAESNALVLVSKACGDVGNAYSVEVVELESGALAASYSRFTSRLTVQIATAAQAKLVTNLAGANNDIEWTAGTGSDTLHAGGNRLSLQYVISGSGHGVTIEAVDDFHLVITAGSAATASQVIAAINPDYSPLFLTGALKAGNSGAGAIVAMPATPFAGGQGSTPAEVKAAIDAAAGDLFATFVIGDNPLVALAAGNLDDGSDDSVFDFTIWED